MQVKRIAAATSITLLAFVSGVSGQTQRQRARGTAPANKPAQTKPAEQPAKQPTKAVSTTPAATPPPAGALALLNGQAITLNDIPDANLRTAIQGQDEEIKRMRQPTLDQMIGELLLENEAKKVGVTVDQLVDQQVKSKIADPTEEQIVAFFNQNKQQMGDADLATARPQIADYLRNQKGMELGTQYVSKLRTANQVTAGTDVNSPGLTQTTVLATVNGHKITAGDLDERLKPFIYQLRTQVFEAEMSALNAKINDMLLTDEAKKKNLSAEDMMRAEVVSKLTPPSDAEISKFYQDNKDRISGSFETLKPQIAEYLQQQQASKLQYELAQRLRSGASIQIFVKQPDAPTQKIAVEGGVSRGNVNAPVTVVVFTDMECSHCAAAHPILQEVANSYGDKVRLVIRDFPLSIHPEARKAAEAAHAADAQGKYFEYIDVLYKNQTALDVPSLKKYATNLGLDRSKFDAALDSGMYASVVSKNLTDGQAYAVNATPAIFVNGVKVVDITAVGLRAAIDRALSKGADGRQ